MVTDELLHLVKFDPNELRSAIVKCDQEAEGFLKRRNEVMELAALYRQILKTHGHEATEVPTPAPETPAKDEPVSRGHDRRFRGMKIADAAFKAITEAGGKMHGKKVTQVLLDGGLKFGGKNPMDVLRYSLIRDSRIEKDPTEKNTWRVKVG